VAPTYSIQTPTTSPGAIAVIEVRSDDMDGTMHALGIAPVEVGHARVRNLLGADRGVVARWFPDSVHLMPHGGAAVVREIARRLEERGFGRAAAAAYPEARDRIEARMLAALARARSPLVIDLLLDQPRRWAGASPRDDNERDRALRRLIDPPLVVALGPPNVGKSSLVNALAGRCVSIVADEPGTTRDHVGVMLDLAGLVVLYVDTPGLLEAPSAVEKEAIEIALELAGTADLLLLIGDARSEPIGIPSLTLGARSLTIAARCDLGLPAWPYDAAVSSRTGDGLAELATLIRDRLVPPAMLADPSPWVFWAGGD
jgi:hypothetical protein